ncbi:MAG: HipA family kinase [Candidatus Competibacter sp.]
MEQIEIGLMLPGAKRFNDQNMNPTWKTHVKTHDSIVVAYVKRISHRKLFVECVCSVLGRHLGLPIPKPLIIKITNENFKDIPISKYELAFGSEDAGYPSFRRYLKNNEAMKKLKNFSKTLDVGVFDEWIANWDRNVGNILYDGSEKFSFIDHENAIDPTLKPGDPAKSNQIISALYVAQSEFEKHKINRDVQSTIISQYRLCSCSLLSEKTYASSYLDESQIISVIDFLVKRLDNLKNLFEDRLCIRQKKIAL